MTNTQILFNTQNEGTYRQAIAAADVLAAPTVGSTSAAAGGSLPDGTYKVKVVGANSFGRTTATAGADVATSGANNSVRIPITQLAGATYYDIYVSTDTDPKWVGRITEAQRASGILITAVGTTGAGGVAGAVDVRVAGTGAQAGTNAAQNTAYALPTVDPISCAGRQYIDIDVLFTAGGDGSTAATLVVIPFYKNKKDGNFYAGQVFTFSFGGAANVFESRAQRLRLEARGNQAVHLVVAKIAGQNPSVDFLYSIS